MLVLNRYIGQSIDIGDHIKIHFLEDNNGRIKIGIEAPRYIRVLRSEILDKLPLLKRNGKNEVI